MALADLLISNQAFLASQASFQKHETKNPDQCPGFYRWSKLRLSIPAFMAQDRDIPRAKSANLVNYAGGMSWFSFRYLLSWVVFLTSESSL